MHGIMSARQPVYIMQPQPQRNDGSIFTGLGGFVLSVLGGLLLGQFGGGLGGASTVSDRKMGERRD